MSSPQITERNTTQPQQQQITIPNTVTIAAAAAAAFAKEGLKENQAPAAAFAQQQAPAIAQKLAAAAAAAAAEQAPGLDAQENAQFSTQLGKDICDVRKSEQHIIEGISEFLARGGDPKAVWSDGRNFPTLLSALYQGRFVLAEALVKNFGCDVNVKQGLNAFSAVYMSREGFDKMAALRKVLALGTNLIDAENSTLLHSALDGTMSDDLFEALFDLPVIKALVNHSNRDGYTPLQWGAFIGHCSLRKLEVLIHNGASQIPSLNGTLAELVGLSERTAEQKAEILEALEQLKGAAPVRQEGN